jgi:DNA polymerase I-like protein with 3'-5' exonuclease and polymerase domains
MFFPKVTIPLSHQVSKFSVHTVSGSELNVGPRLGLSVPLKVELGTGHNWREAHP